MANPGGHNRMSAILRAFGDMDISDRGVRLGYMQALTGRTITSPGQLGQDEQRDLLAKIESCRGTDGVLDRDHLDRLRDQATEAGA